METSISDRAGLSGKKVTRPGSPRRGPFGLQNVTSLCSRTRPVGRIWGSFRQHDETFSGVIVAFSRCAGPMDGREQHQAPANGLRWDWQGTMRRLMAPLLFHGAFLPKRVS